MSDIDILVPVLARPQNVHPFMESVKVTSHSYRVFFICSPSDKEQIKTCRAADATTLITNWQPGKADFARKINWAFPQTDAPWVFQAADDLRFHPGWDVYAIKLGDRREVGVVGTDDMGNALVKRGGHSTHSLIRRTYINQYGGTIDNTGLVFCELYDHQFVDNEFVQTAIRRGQWAFSKRSKVEHLHPNWNKSKLDATYEKALRATGSDGHLYLKRMRSGTQLDRKARREAVIAERAAMREERRKALFQYRNRKRKK